MLSVALYIVAVFFGLMFGNYATSFIHRIPHKKPCLGNKHLRGVPPHCASCNARLKFKQYMPLFGFLLAKGKCVYCGAKIPKIYPITEFYGALLGGVLYHFIGMNYFFIFCLISLVVAYSFVIIVFLKVKYVK